ncbi:MAG: hypothetical protein ABJA81_01770 [Nocardioidaceae bacterium]
MSHDRPTINLSGPQILAGALAAASAAVVSSWMGVAGTVLGAVVVSLVASIGAALYTPSLERSSQKLRETLPVKAVRPGGTPTVVPPAVETPAPAPANRRSSHLQWRTVAPSAAASLVLGLALLTGFEAILGKPASSLTGSGGSGGTTVSSLIAHHDDTTDTTPMHANTSEPGTSGDGSGVAPGATDPSPSTSTPTPTQDTEPTPSQPTPTEPTPTGPSPTVPSTPTPTGSANSARF